MFTGVPVKSLSILSGADSQCGVSQEIKAERFTEAATQDVVASVRAGPRPGDAGRPG
jgi:hypothetical protein